MPTSRTLAIGDIHGCLSHLDALLAAVELKAQDHLILLGDYVDRGPDSAGVLDRIIELSRTHHVTALMGNHEQMMLDARRDADYLSIWVHFGGNSTLASYSSERQLRHVPPHHWKFLDEALVGYFETETHIFVHAGAMPEAAMDQQSLPILLWKTFYEVAPHQSGKTLVCGHTIQESARPNDLGFAICLDTGAGSGGPLTCLNVESGELWQADSAGAVTRAHLSDIAGKKDAS